MKTLIMKTFLTSLALMQVVLLIYCFLSCSEEFDFGNVKNAVKTSDISNILQSSAVVSANVITDNGASLIARGICYGIDDNPTIQGSKKAHASSILGSFSCMLDNLSPSTTYFARAYATNSYGTAYGTSITFTTLAATVPIISSTTAANLITANSANSGGLIINSGASNVTSRGVCYSNTVTSPTISETKTTDGEGIGLFVSTLTGLTANTTYYIRAYATNGVGTAYGDVKSFKTTSVTIPNGITTNPTAFISKTTSISGGSIASDGGASITSKGVCWSTTTSNPTIANSKTIDGTGIGSFTSSLIGLTSLTTYYVRAYATNSVGTAYGNSVTFTTVSSTIPTGVVTTNISSITSSSSISGGSIASDEGASITSKGICWSNTTSSPTIANSKTVDGTGISSFTSSLTGLSPGTTYYVRAYATNGIGTAYGDIKTFNTVGATIPNGIITNPITFISQTTSISGGGITSDGGASITSKGVCWSNTTSNPTIANSKTVDGTGLSSYTSSLTGLSPGTTYYVRAYATNSSGTSYGNSLSFNTTAATIPNGITTNPPSFISQTTSTSGGSITSDGGASITSKGICWSNTTSSPTIANSKTVDGTGISSFTSSLTSLSPGTIYYMRAYATNSIGTAYGGSYTFNTLSATIPLGVMTTNISTITLSSSISGGSITSDGGASITSKGVCWSNTTSSPTIANSKTVDGKGISSFTSSLTDLSPGTTYYVRAYATNSTGTAYGSYVSFTTTTEITIGTQTWKTKNLDVSTYSDGTVIPQVTDQTSWAGLTTGAWCYYNSDSANGVTYGKLYNWYAVAGIWNEASKTDFTQRKKLAPTGYHIPSDAEWTTLITYLGGEGVAGGKMKATGTSLWQSPNYAASNESGFTGLPGGYISGAYSYYAIGDFGYWWSSSENSTTTAWARYLNYGMSYAVREKYGLSKANGFSVRCLKD